MRRHPRNPILTRQDVPAAVPLLDDVSSVFNPGAVRFDGRDRLLLRVQARSRESLLVAASSKDGVHFEVADSPTEIHGLDSVGERVFHVYDPRITVLDGALHIVFAADTDGSCRLGIARGETLSRLELISYSRERDSRNGVLFPEKIGGRYARLERPNEVLLDDGPRSGDAVVLATSDDLVEWQVEQELFRGRPRYWDERIGAGPPPVKTPAGWLLVYHGVATHFQSSNLYQAGAVLLDLHDPTVVLGRTRCNVLEPRELYECVGQVPGVVFPSGWIADVPENTEELTDETELRVYYGAADTCVGLATTTVGALLAVMDDPRALGG